MLNIIIMFIEIIFIFTAMAMLTKLLGRYGAISYVSIATIVADILALQSIKVAGINIPIFVVLFISIFIATNLITECYGVNIARKSVYTGLCINIIFTSILQIILWCSTPTLDAIDYTLKNFFPFNATTIISLTIVYFVPLIINTFVYEKLIGKDRNKYMWLRNIISTTICGWAISLILTIITSIGRRTIKETIITIGSVLIIELITILCSTPFLYLTKYLLKKRFIKRKYL